MAKRLEKLVAGVAIVLGTLVSCQGFYGGIKYDDINKKISGAYTGEAIAGIVTISAGLDYLRRKKKETNL